MAEIYSCRCKSTSFEENSHLLRGVLSELRTPTDSLLRRARPMSLPLMGDWIPCDA